MLEVKILMIPFLSKAVVFPETNEEVSKILILCNEHKIPVVPFGTGTSSRRKCCW